MTRWELYWAKVVEQRPSLERYPESIISMKGYEFQRVLHDFFDKGRQVGIEEAKEMIKRNKGEQR